MGQFDSDNYPGLLSLKGILKSRKRISKEQLRKEFEKYLARRSVKKVVFKKINESCR